MRYLVLSDRDIGVANDPVRIDGDVVNVDTNKSNGLTPKSTSANLIALIHLCLGIDDDVGSLLLHEQAQCGTAALVGRGNVHAILKSFNGVSRAEDQGVLSVEVGDRLSRQSSFLNEDEQVALAINTGAVRIHRERIIIAEGLDCFYSSVQGALKSERLCNQRFRFSYSLNKTFAGL